MSAALDRLRDAVATLEPDVPEEDWCAFAELWSTSSLRRGEHLVRIGETTDRVLFVIEGVMRAYWMDENGSEYNKTFFEEMSFATPIAAILQRKPSHLGFQALTEVVALSASMLELLSLADERVSIERVYRRHLETKWVVAKEQREIRLATADAARRYEWFLEEFPTLEQRIPLYHIASHLGITAVQLSRIRARRTPRRRRV